MYSQLAKLLYGICFIALLLAMASANATPILSEIPPTSMPVVLEAISKDLPGFPCGQKTHPYYDISILTSIVRVTMPLCLALNEAYNRLITSRRWRFYGLDAHTGVYHGNN